MTTTSSVIKLQQLALDTNIPIIELLNNAYVIALKLDINDFSAWCQKELHGYQQDDQIPAYRIFRGHMYASDSSGYKPVVLSGKNAEYYEMKIIRDAVTNLQSLKSTNENHVLLKLDPEIEKFFIEKFAQDDRQRFSRLGLTSNPYYDLVAPTYMPVLAISKAQIEHVFVKIRDIILNWSLSLEKQGILGDGLIFTKQEKQMTQNVNYNIGNVGNMANHNDNSTINQTSTNTVQVIKGDFNSLASKLKDYGVEETDIQDLRNVIDVTPTPTSSDELGEGVTNWLGKMSLKALKGSLKVGKDVAMGVLVEAITTYYCG
ncbi:AbiTii domain-containing protein [Acinetobacter variabilis]|uniref:AbiTii domain-containing protein n=1 Tax=Acinetobacter variabilis TaxID=70346 RepID=UPI00289B2AFF|nr:hypothetical protein [Acinetobacter variabilis]